MADGRYYDSLYARMMHVYYRVSSILSIIFWRNDGKSQHFFLQILFRNFIATQDEPLHQVFEELYPGTPSFAVR